MRTNLLYFLADLLSPPWPSYAREKAGRGSVTAGKHSAPPVAGGFLFLRHTSSPFSHHRRENFKNQVLPLHATGKGFTETTACPNLVHHPVCLTTGTRSRRNCLPDASERPLAQKWKAGRSCNNFSFMARHLFPALLNASLRGIRTELNYNLSNTLLKTTSFALARAHTGHAGGETLVGAGSLHGALGRQTPVSSGLHLS